MELVLHRVPIRPIAGYIYDKAHRPNFAEGTLLSSITIFGRPFASRRQHSALINYSRSFLLCAHHLIKQSSEAVC